MGSRPISTAKFRIQAMLVFMEGHWLHTNSKVYKLLTEGKTAKEKLQATKLLEYADKAASVGYAVTKIEALRKQYAEYLD